MALSDFMADFGDDVYYDPEIRNVLEDHMTYFRQNYCQPIVLAPSESYQWRGDLFGLLASKGYQRKYHWFIMRLNQYTSPLQFKDDTIALLIPDSHEIDLIIKSHKSISRIS